MKRKYILVFLTMIVLVFPSRVYAQSMHRIEAENNYYAIAKAEWNERNIERWRNMSEKEKQDFKEKMRRWENMEPEKREEIKKLYKKFKNLPVEKKKKIKNNWRRFRNLDPKKRKELRKKFMYWKNMDPEKRERMKERMENFRQMSPEERRGMKKQFREMYRNGDKDIPIRGGERRIYDEDSMDSQYDNREMHYNYKIKKR